MTPLSVYDLGGDGAPLVMVHASSFHGRVWQPVADHLGDAFRCVTLDLRGHGDSPLPAGWDFDWRGFADDVLTGADTFGPGPVRAVGHSSGATALLLAEERRPGTFSAIWCYEPVLVPADPPLGPDPDSWMAAQARRRRDVFATREEARGSYAAKPPFSSFAPTALDAYVGYAFEDLPEGGVRLKCRPETEARVAEMATAHDGFSLLAEVRCPVILTSGSDSEGAADEALLKALTDALPDLRIEELDGLSHYGPLESPETVAASIRGALS